MTVVTPMVTLLARHSGRTARVLLKLDMFGPTGSTKDRTAHGLVGALHEESPVRPGDVVIESTSGNLGIAMARLLRPLGCRFVAVVDANTSPAARTTLAEAGAEVLVVTEPDATGGFLLNRLRLVERLCRENATYRWTNQYRNPANPAIHERTTGPELAAQAGPDLDAVFVAVSTGGTLAGVSRHLRTARPSVRVTAVDARGSVALHRRAGRRLLSGIGSSLPSGFLTRADYDRASWISDIDAFALCRRLRAETGLAIGGSSGCVLFACLVEAFGIGRRPRTPVCLLPDGGHKYECTFYDDAWLRSHGLLSSVRHAERALRVQFPALDLETAAPPRAGLDSVGLHATEMESQVGFVHR